VAYNFALVVILSFYFKKQQKSNHHHETMCTITHLHTEQNVISLTPKVL